MVPPNIPLLLIINTHKYAQVSSTDQANGAILLWPANNQDRRLFLGQRAQRIGLQGEKRESDKERNQWDISFLPTNKPSALSLSDVLSIEDVEQMGEMVSIDKLIETPITVLTCEKQS